MAKRYLKLLCLFFTLILLIMGAYPVNAQDKSIAFAKAIDDNIYYIQFESTTQFYDKLSYFIQVGEKTEENYSFGCGKFGFRYYPGAENSEGFYVGSYYNILHYFKINGYVPDEILIGRVSLALGYKIALKNCINIDIGVQIGDKYESATSYFGEGAVPGFIVALGYSW